MPGPCNRPPTCARRFGELDLLHLTEEVEDLAAARNLAAADLLDHDGPEAVAALPGTCPHALDQILDHGWLPPNRHGRAP
jgi:hypothetical protein